jgi:enamine deaminase RidA (YjgF/YER057c/UK114 family)
MYLFRPIIASRMICQNSKNLGQTLKMSMPEQVVKITLLCVDHNAEKQRLISLERNAMWNGDRKPASTLIPVPKLAVDGMLFEIDAVAVISNS